jgi:threonine dehydrogenase-like Zn-dependent dehydrogenase
MEVALELIARGRVDVAEMVTDRLGLAETGRGFGLMARGGASLKVVIDPTLDAEIGTV